MTTNGAGKNTKTERRPSGNASVRHCGKGGAEKRQAPIRFADVIFTTAAGGDRRPSGGIFSVIEDNHIHHINNKQNLSGAEIAGIKLHAAIDTVIRRNHFHHCTRGLWLDWQTQGTRVTQNLFHDNCLPLEGSLSMEHAGAFGEDIFLEVSHGPTLIDHNLLLSDCALKLPTQGAAVVHNLIAGSFTAVGRGVSNGTVTKLRPAIRRIICPQHGARRLYDDSAWGYEIL